MEPATLSVPILLGASMIIYWSGRKRPKSQVLAAARITTLLFVLFVWQWVWQHTPADAFTSALWRQVSFAPPVIGILCLIALDARRVLRTKESGAAPPPQEAGRPPTQRSSSPPAGSPPPLTPPTVPASSEPLAHAVYATRRSGASPDDAAGARTLTLQTD